MAPTVADLTTALDATLTAVERTGARPHSLLVRQHDRLLADVRWAPWGGDEPCLAYSCSKTFTSAAVGLAVADGAFGYQDTLAELWPEATDGAGPRARRIRIRDALAMATGHSQQQADEVATAMAWNRRPTGVETARAFLAAEPVSAPGTAFAYNNLATWMLSRVVARTTGRDVADLLGPVLDRIGIGPVPWTRDLDGIPLGYSGMHLSPDQLARFAQLLADDGVHAGRRLLPADWIAGHRVSHIDSDGVTGPDWGMGYGWQVWRSRHGYRIDGAMGQLALILPEADAVVVTTNNIDGAQPVMDAIWTHLWPALEARATGVNDDVEPDRRTLEVPVIGGDPAPARTVRATTIDGDRVTITPARSGWTLDWRRSDGRRAAVRVGCGEWLHTHLRLPEGELEIAASGGWSGAELTIDLAVVTTPHTLRLCWSPEGLSEQWDTEPLNPGGLFGQARPDR
ncbi:serine hydrolase domain-containing protein [Acidipropionibacterium virtanenii]|uniref:Beta-lactamase-related domain-containing protein n=1 Tax=Acidipropionibacterium virtanenii TaxID=2057246 RepID=A0A344UT69_9ACTN|nr:serine hydrolase domain-containing protein [Acidipropionibacterium virtanenii]AXE38467.1 hypothetical protein JS278_01291 [Acidipropionibacterium virtanenii]